MTGITFARKWSDRPVVRVETVPLYCTFDRPMVGRAFEDRNIELYLE